MQFFLLLAQSLQVLLYTLKIELNTISKAHMWARMYVEYNHIIEYHLEIYITKQTMKIQK